MVRAPARSCPNLSRIVDDAEPGLVAAFLGTKAFAKLSWLQDYRIAHDDAAAADAAAAMLMRETKDRIGPLESEAARIVTIAGTRGQFALDGLARTKLEPQRLKDIINQRDELARSLWAYIHESPLFEAAENSLHLRLYRRYDKHYQTFMVDPPQQDTGTAGVDALDRLLEDLGARLNRGEGYCIDRYDIPGDTTEPASEMYLLFHPNPPTSVREIDDDGNRSRFYFRPPGEAMIVFTPSTGRVHVRAANRTLRHEIAESFIETVLGQSPSDQPVDFRAYDISRFFEGFELPLPDFDDVTVQRAQVIRAEVSIGNLASRLALSTVMTQDICDIIAEQTGLARIFERAVAIRVIEIAVRYRRAGRDRDETLDFTITDRNSSSLLSLDDPFERVLGHRLLRAWDILREGRAPDKQEAIDVLPAVLALWDLATRKVTGAWLHDRKIDARLLTDIGFLVPAGWEDDDLIDDEDSLGPLAAEVVPRPEGPALKVTEGEIAAGGSPDRFQAYRIVDGWVAQHLREQSPGLVDVPAIEILSTNLLALGTLRIDDRDVPVYLVRRLDDERARAAVDTELRRRDDQGIGLVLQAGRGFGSCLAANVLTPLVDHLVAGQAPIAVNRESLTTVFRRNRSLARGGVTVSFESAGEHGGTLFVPDKGSIQITGAHRVAVIRRLVDAHNAGKTPIATSDLAGPFKGQSLANIFGQPLWRKLTTKYLKNVKKGLWEIAA